MIKRIMYSAVIVYSSLALHQHIHAKSLYDYNVFEKWIKIQRVYEDSNITTMSQQLDDAFLSRFKTSFEKEFKNLKDLNHFLKYITGDQISEEGYFIAPPLNNSMKESFKNIYSALQNNPIDFIKLLQNNNFSNEQVNTQEQSAHYDATVEKYKAFMRLLFPTLLDLQQDEFLFAVGNRLFEYCFNEKTFQH